MELSYSVIADKFQFISQCSINICWPKGWTIFDMIPSLCSLFFNVNLKQARVIQEEITSTEKMVPPDWPVYKPCCIFLTDN